MMAGLRLECKPMTEIERIIEKNRSNDNDI